MRSHKEDGKQRGKSENEDGSARLVPNLSPFRFSIDGHASEVLQAAKFAQLLFGGANMESMFGQGGTFSSA